METFDIQVSEDEISLTLLVIPEDSGRNYRIFHDLDPVGHVWFTGEGETAHWHSEPKFSPSLLQQIQEQIEQRNS